MGYVLAEYVSQKAEPGREAIEGSWTVEPLGRYFF